MKQILILLAVVALSCAREKTPALQTGDLIFVGYAADSSAKEGSMDEAIVSATGNLEAGGAAVNMVHVAIVEVDSCGVWIIDATRSRGVDRYPLDTFLLNNSGRRGNAVFSVMRMKDNSLGDEWIARAKAFIGEPYDNLFLPDNGAMYCSELVRESFRSASGEYLLEDKPMNFKGPDGEFPKFWVELFKDSRMEIPQGVRGTNPQDMSLCPQLYSPGITIP